MPFLIKTDLTPPLYQEVIDEITRGDDAIVDKAINNAIGEMKGYLNRYNVVAMFGTPITIGELDWELYYNDTVNPTFTDDFLKSLGKDIACWQLIKLATPNINLELFRTTYQDAIKYLKMVMKGEADPAWPLKQDDPNTPNDDAGLVEYRSLPKRSNHF